MMLEPDYDQPASHINNEYIMTAHFPIEPGVGVGDTFMIWCVKPGGWVKGPRIAGTIIGPTGDWGRFMPDGTLKMDVRATLQTDDGAAIYLLGCGRFHCDEATTARLERGETIGADEAYIMYTFTFETGDDRYAWLNQTVAVGKLISLQDKSGGHVTVEIFAVG